MTAETRRLLCQLADAFGVPGMEDEVRALMAEALAPVAEISYDRFGCLIARHVGSSERPRVMLPAHMDEVGLIVRQITDDGFLRFVTTGGWWSQVLVSQRWTVRTRRATCRLTAECERRICCRTKIVTKPIPMKDMFLDIGARNKEEALAMGVRPGDPAAPWSPVAELGNGRLLGKAWDDRVGCALIIETLRQLVSAGTPTPSTRWAPRRRRRGCTARRRAPMRLSRRWPSWRSARWRTTCWE